ncbi:hypothetical protein [Lysinibacillus sp. NPDC093692]|uniref:hypothetical protein n=1 Tax=Lysinibacillus sp. NPDC093692 TaxID=3390578 RepID=UPI003D090B8C
MDRIDEVTEGRVRATERIAEVTERRVRETERTGKATENLDETTEGSCSPSPHHVEIRSIET